MGAWACMPFVKQRVCTLPLRHLRVEPRWACAAADLLEQESRIAVARLVCGLKVLAADGGRLLDTRIIASHELNELVPGTAHDLLELLSNK